MLWGVFMAIQAVQNVLYLPLKPGLKLRPSWGEVMNKGSMIISRIIAVIAGGFLGLLFGSIIRIFVVEIIPVNSQEAFDNIRLVASLIQVVCMVFGATMFYKRVAR